MADGRLPDGSRVNAIIPPARRRRPGADRPPLPRDRLHRRRPRHGGSLSEPAADVPRPVHPGKLNVLISGGTGTGKTTLLNVLSALDPRSASGSSPSRTPPSCGWRQPHVVSLESRPANIEGAGQVAIRDLVRNALRMRPDRIVVGEVRGGEALDMLQAMNTGHEGSMTTVHANSPRDALSRIETMVLMSGIELPLRAIREQVGQRHRPDRAAATGRTTASARRQPDHRGAGPRGRHDHPAGRLHPRSGEARWPAPTCARAASPRSRRTGTHRRPAPVPRHPAAGATRCGKAADAMTALLLRAAGRAGGLLAVVVAARLRASAGCATCPPLLDDYSATGVTLEEQRRPARRAGPDRAASPSARSPRPACSARVRATLARSDWTLTPGEFLATSAAASAARRRHRAARPPQSSSRSCSASPGLVLPFAAGQPVGVPAAAASSRTSCPTCSTCSPPASSPVRASPRRSSSSSPRHRTRPPASSPGCSPPPGSARPSSRACELMAERLDSRDLVYTVQAISVQQRTGGRLAEVLRHRRRLHAQPVRAQARDLGPDRRGSALGVPARRTALRHRRGRVRRQPRLPDPAVHHDGSACSWSPEPGC